MNIAIPSIQTGLSADLLSTSWVLNAYNLMYAVLLITVGRFADQYVRKRLLLVGFSALQGIGAAGLTPVSLAIMMAVFPRQKRGAAIGVWGAVGGMGAAFGPSMREVMLGFVQATKRW